MIVAGLVAVTVILTGIAIRVGVARGITTRMITAAEPEPALYVELGAFAVVPAVPVFIAISGFMSLPTWASATAMAVVAFGIVLTIRRVSAGRAPRKAWSSAHTSVTGIPAASKAGMDNLPESTGDIHRRQQHE